MQVTVTIPDELAAQVQARGFALETYVRDLVQEKLSKEQGSAGPHEMDPEEFNASLDALTRYSHKIPALPIDAFSRESLYADHD